MPNFILHRLNSLKDLNRLSSPDWGCEIDIRSDLHHPGKMHLSHDPWVQGEDISVWLEKFKDLKIKGPLILNTKEDGLEERLISKMQKFGVENYFFLDTTIPSLVRWLSQGNTHFALRVSKHESILSSSPLLQTCTWAWIDCFDRQALMPSEVATMSQKKCLVSPELVGGSPADFSTFKDLARVVDWICTKHPEEWINRLA